MKKAWQGRFEKETSSIMESFNSSISFDKKIYKEDIQGSIAHAKMLAKTGVLTQLEKNKIIEGLNKIEKEIKNNKFVFKDSDEDIHMAIEKRLTQITGEVGKKLHTARSRNDQVNIDIRLYLKKEINKIKKLLKTLVTSLYNKALANEKTILPGFTHMQAAQPVTLAFHFLAYIFMFLRDHDRFCDLLKRVDVLTLGSGAIAGTNYKTDRDFLAASLDMAKVSENAMDSVSDRDFLIEFLSNAAICSMHLSRLNEELIIWATGMFDFICIDDRYATGSSIMPNKKNPDACELIRGKTGRTYGNLVTLLTVMKGLPLSYNKDLQEDKGPVFDTTDNLKICLEIMKEIIGTLKINKEKMKDACEKGFVQATDIADYLVKKGMPFRKAHEITGKIVLFCEKKSKTLTSLSIDEYKKHSKLFEKDIYNNIDLLSVINNKQSYGSTSFSSVKKQLNIIKKRLAKL